MGKWGGRWARPRAHLGRQSGRQPAAVACQPCAADSRDARAPLHLPGPVRAPTSQAPAAALRSCCRSRRRHRGIRCHCGDPWADVGIRRHGGRGSVDDAVRSRRGAPAARPRAREAPCQATGWYVLAAEPPLPAPAHPRPCSPQRLRGPRRPTVCRPNVCTRRGRVAAASRRARPLLPAPQARAHIDRARRGACRPHDLPSPHLLRPPARPAARASAAAARAHAK